MFEELEKYKLKGHFLFSENDSLDKVCNAPKDGMGVYVVYTIKNSNIELVYVGVSGKINQKGLKKVRKGGMYDRLVNGKQFNKLRKISWKEKIKSEKIENLAVYWYVTFNEEFIDIPSVVKAIVMQKHFEVFGILPKWNKEF